jgi:hypothetical protein
MTSVGTNHLDEVSAEKVGIDKRRCTQSSVPFSETMAAMLRA